jgi:hypothetical protein
MKSKASLIVAAFCIAASATQTSFATTTYYPGSICSLINNDGTNATSWYSYNKLLNNNSTQKWAICQIANPGGLRHFRISAPGNGSSDCLLVHGGTTFGSANYAQTPTSAEYYSGVFVEYHFDNVNYDGEALEFQCYVAYGAYVYGIEVST